jgi:hypothetical protein
MNFIPTKVIDTRTNFLNIIWFILPTIFLPRIDPPIAVTKNIDIYSSSIVVIEILDIDRMGF